MDRAFIDILREVAPSVYPEEIALDCAPGWFPIMYTLSKRLALLNVVYKVTCKEVHIDYAKEKFGTLRIFTYGGGDKDSEEAVNEAELASTVTCDQCGRLGELRKGSWLRTLCNRCAINLGYKK